MVAQQQHRRTATLFGLADQAHSQIHDAIAGPMRPLADAALAAVQATLEPAVFAAAFAAGEQLSLADAFTQNRQTCHFRYGGKAYAGRSRAIVYTSTNCPSRNTYPASMPSMLKPNFL